MNAKVGNSGGPNPLMRLLMLLKLRYGIHMFEVYEKMSKTGYQIAHTGTDKGFLGNLSTMQFRYCKLSTFIKVLLLLKVSEANILIYQIE